MSLYSYFVEASKQSDLPNPNGSLSASVSPITIKEANEAACANSRYQPFSNGPGNEASLIMHAAKRVTLDNIWAYFF